MIKKFIEKDIKITHNQFLFLIYKFILNNE